MSHLILDGETVRPADAPEKPRVPVGGLIPEATYPFTTLHHHDWDFHEDALSPEGEWRPKISELRHVPGGNGTYTTGHGPASRVNPNPAIAAVESKGSIVVRQDDRRLGAYRYYLRRYLLTSGKWFYCYAGVQIALINRGRNAVPRLDPAWMRGFQMQLLTGGLIDPMPAETLNAHILILENRINEWDQIRGQGRLTEDAFRRMVEESETRIERMREAYERQFGEIQTRGAVSAALPDDPGGLAIEGSPVIEDGVSPAPAAATHDKGSLVQVAEGLERTAGREVWEATRADLGMSADTALQRFGIETLRGYIASLRELVQ